MAVEIIIRIKDHFKSLTHKTKVFQKVTAELEDPVIDELISKIEKDFASPNPVKVSVSLKVVED